MGILESKYTIMKNSLMELNSRFEMAEELYLKKTNANWKKNEQSHSDLWNKIKSANINVMGIPEREKRE